MYDITLLFEFLKIFGTIINVSNYIKRMGGDHLPWGLQCDFYKECKENMLDSLLSGRYCGALNVLYGKPWEIYGKYYHNFTAFYVEIHGKYR